jgi:hypothetical protein
VAVYLERCASFVLKPFIVFSCISLQFLSSEVSIDQSKRCKRNTVEPGTFEDFNYVRME